MNARSSLAAVLAACSIGSIASALVGGQAAGAASCVRPVMIHVNSHQRASGNVKDFAFHTTDVYVKAPRFDVLSVISANSGKKDAKIISLIGIDSNGKRWKGIRTHPNVWHHDSVSRKHIYIKSFTADGCLG